MTQDWFGPSGVNCLLRWLCLDLIRVGPLFSGDEMAQLFPQSDESKDNEPLIHALDFYSSLEKNLKR